MGRVGIVMMGRDLRVAATGLGLAFIGAVLIAWVFSAALYWLLIDTRQLPELIAGVVAATIAATGAELARAQGIVGESIRAREAATTVTGLSRTLTPPATARSQSPECNAWTAW